MSSSRPPAPGAQWAQPVVLCEEGGRMAPGFSFRPVAGGTVRLQVGAVPTPAGTLKLAEAGQAPADAALVRVRNASVSMSPVTFVLTTDPAVAAALPTAFTTAGVGGTRGGLTLDPGAVELFALSAAQRDALAKGLLYLSAVTPLAGSALLDVTPG